MIHPIDWGHAAPYLLAALAFGYLLGAIPFGVLVTRLAGLGDIRRIGSGNIGATNVLRAGSKGLAALTLVLDVSKGAAAVLLGGLYGPDLAIVTALGAMLGHLFPVWLGFRGGKGVATALGILLAFSWQVGLLAAGIWIALIAATRYSSVGALGTTAVTPFLCLWLASPQITEFITFICVLIWVRHAGNIRRLINRTETRLGKQAGEPGG
ncbi:MAG: glycerol-3-phosphate 1-O-acyltransferase PlsY [Alphaproteobacteria bacterium]